MLFAAWSGYGGTSLYDPLAIAACNALLFVPITAYALNRPVPPRLAVTWPALYRAGPLAAHLSAGTVAVWIMRAVVQAGPLPRPSSPHVPGLGGAPSSRTLAAAALSPSSVARPPPCLPGTATGPWALPGLDRPGRP